MKKEEIYFLRMCGWSIQDEIEAVTTDSIDKFPDISTYLQIMGRITGKDLLSLYDTLKYAIYVSCMIHYTVECYKKNLISKEVYNNVMSKAENMLKQLKDEKIVALMLLYEGPSYLHQETLFMLKKAGFSKIAKAYCDIFGSLMKRIEDNNDINNIRSNEKEAYMELYKNFMKLKIKNDK